jgi:hypothetical protein
MPDKYLVEFVAKWIEDEGLRKRVLHREVKKLAAWGLTQQQSSDLRSLDKQRILTRLVDELEKDLGIDLQKILDDIADTGGVSGDGGGAVAAAYDEGRTHVRGIEPQTIPSGTESMVVVRGHGFDDSLEVFFVPFAGGSPVKGHRLDLDHDIDVWQRAKVKVTLPSAGKWRVMGRVGSNDPTDSTEDVQLEST